ncbi:MAG: VCBS repeat-containing protein [Phycisphaeraceae bacterium]|nr:VCBS repeat-containing protein [Phycisphaeraceae bacterium]
MRTPAPFALAAATIASAVATASATWSIILIDTRTGEVALGSATCLTNFDLQAGTPVLIPRVGGATAQSFVDQGGFNRTFIRDRLLDGTHPEQIIAMLAGFDGGHQTRQYGIADVHGGTATFTGSSAGSWAGGLTGRVGDVVYAIQGNVLAGAPVVTECAVAVENALINGADLAEAMMIGMQEARAWGGDGRCNCGNPPDGCGSPPAGWDPETGKSAHIAYMLIARDGDGFGCNGIYRAFDRPVGIAIADLDGDTFPDVALGNTEQGRVTVHRNTSAGKPYATIVAAPAIYSVGGSPRSIAAGRINADDAPDLVVPDSLTGVLSVLHNAGDGTFQAAAPQFVGGTLNDVIVADLDGKFGDDVALVSTSDASVKVLLNTGGSLGGHATVPVGGTPTSITGADFNLDGHLDLAVADESGNRVVILLNNGAGGFVVSHQLPVGARPTAIATGDIDGDGLPDVATANTNGASVSVLLNKQTGFERTDLPNPTRPTAVAIADLDGDTLADLVVNDDLASTFTVFLGRPNDVPAKERTYAEMRNAHRITAADLNLDGRIDLVANFFAFNALTVISGAHPRHGIGLFASGVGCATADYYMEFNVAFQTQQSPDPVVQLQAKYDAWRADLIGRPDAVRSDAHFAAERLPLGATATMTIDARDWTDSPVAPGLTVAVAHATDSAGIAAPQPAIDNGDGTYTIHLVTAHAPPDSRGIDRYLVLLDDGAGARPVILMPRPELRIVAPVADWNDDGVVNGADLTAFLADFTARDPATDLNADTIIDSRDALLFLNAWAGN